LTIRHQHTKNTILKAIAFILVGKNLKNMKPKRSDYIFTAFCILNVRLIQSIV